jgi:hypothetical protein
MKMLTTKQRVGKQGAQKLKEKLGENYSEYYKQIGRKSAQKLKANLGEKYVAHMQELVRKSAEARKAKTVRKKQVARRRAALKAVITKYEKYGADHFKKSAQESAKKRNTEFKTPQEKHTYYANLTRKLNKKMYEKYGAEYFREKQRKQASKRRRGKIKRVIQHVLPTWTTELQTLIETLEKLKPVYEDIQQVNILLLSFKELRKQEQKVIDDLIETIKKELP